MAGPLSSHRDTPTPRGALRVTGAEIKACKPLSSGPCRASLACLPSLCLFTGSLVFHFRNPGSPQQVTTTHSALTANSCLGSGNSSHSFPCVYLDVIGHTRKASTALCTGSLGLPDLRWVRQGPPSRQSDTSQRLAPLGHRVPPV